MSISVGPNYDTMRMEFVDALVQMGQGNPMVQQATADLVMKASDFPGADEAAERLKLLLPPPIQQMLAQGKDMPPEVMMAMQQAQQAMQAAQEHEAMLQQAMAELQQEQAATEADKAEVQAQRAQIQADIKVANAEFAKQRAEFDAMVARFEASQAIKQTEPKEGDE